MKYRIILPRNNASPPGQEGRRANSTLPADRPIMQPGIFCCAELRHGRNKTLRFYVPARLSSALMPLDGTIHFTHDEGLEICLSPFQTDVFDGGARTVSEGECQDFNVMWHKDAPFSVILEAVTAYPCRQMGASLDFYYAYRGTFHLKTGGEDLTISPGMLICLWQADEICIEADEPQQATPIIHVAIH